MSTTWMERQIESLEAMTVVEWAWDAEAYHSDRLAQASRGLGDWDGVSLSKEKRAELEARVAAIRATQRASYAR